MKNFKYNPFVDSAYIAIQDQDVFESEEIAEGIIVDYDADNNIIGVELLGVKTINYRDFT